MFFFFSPLKTFTLLEIQNHAPIIIQTLLIFFLMGKV